VRSHHLGRRRRRATPRIPHERFDRATRLAATDMSELTRMWRSLR